MIAPRWLILADDLTGAADTAIAFVRRGWSASVAWGGAAPDDDVLALDADSRRMAAPDAAARHMALLAAHGGGRGALFKKIDSTLRGPWAAELAATLRSLPGRMALVAPAFPRQGRRVVGGRVMLDGEALEATALWAREHSYPSADLLRILAGEGLRVGHAIGVQEALAEGIDALVCDAREDGDLEAMVQSAAPAAERLLWVGSAGLAHALAETRQGAAPALPQFSGGILIVVGSLAEAARAGAGQLAADPSVLALRFTAEWRDMARLNQALAAGRDVLVTTDAAPGPADVEEVRRLATAIAATRPGALIATGGETARAVLGTLGATALRMIDEIEPGVPLGLARAMPAITKAGGFGDAGTLPRCLAFLRRLRRAPNDHD